MPTVADVDDVLPVSLVVASDELLVLIDAEHVPPQHKVDALGSSVHATPMPQSASVRHGSPSAALPTKQPARSRVPKPGASSELICSSLSMRLPTDDSRADEQAQSQTALRGRPRWVLFSS